MMLWEEGRLLLDDPVSRYLPEFKNPKILVKPASGGVEGVKAPLSELGSAGEYDWGGFFYTAFWIDPQEQMIVVFMAQLHPTGDLGLDRQVHALAYQVIVD